MNGFEDEVDDLKFQLLDKLAVVMVKFFSSGYPSSSRHPSVSNSYYYSRGGGASISSNAPSPVLASSYGRTQRYPGVMDYPGPTSSKWNLIFAFFMKKYPSFFDSFSQNVFIH